MTGAENNTPDILKTILNDKKEYVASCKAKISLADIKALAKDTAPARGLIIIFNLALKLLALRSSLKLKKHLQAAALFAKTLNRQRLLKHMLMPAHRVYQF